MEDAFGATEADRKWCREEIAKLRNEGVFTPPSLRGSLMVPGNIGGMAWGGAAFDAAHHLLIVPVNNIAAEVRLIPRKDYAREREDAGRSIGGDWEFAAQGGTPYGMARRMLRAPGGSICSPPPWGTLNAIDADTGEVRWTKPMGQFPGAPAGFGSVALGGPIVTAGGLVFMAGTLDSAIRAYDVTTGDELWKGELPTSARSTPMTFRGPDGEAIRGSGRWRARRPGDGAVERFAGGVSSAVRCSGDDRKFHADGARQGTVGGAGGGWDSLPALRRP